MNIQKKTLSFVFMILFCGLTGLVLIIASDAVTDKVPVPPPLARDALDNGTATDKVLLPIAAQKTKELTKVNFNEEFTMSLPGILGQKRCYIADKVTVKPKIAANIDTAILTQDNVDIEWKFVPNNNDSKNAMDGSDVFTLTNMGIIKCDRASGVLSGHLINKGGVWENGAVVSMDVTVMDLSNATSVRVEEKYREKIHDLSLFIYTDWIQPKDGDPFDAFLEFINIADGVPAYVGSRCRFIIDVMPTKIIYDPNENPLRIILPNKWTAVVGDDFLGLISVVGGLEPYEFKVDGLPDGLVFDRDKMATVGIPTVQGEYDITISVKDKQFPADQWSAAKAAKDNPGNPYVEGVIALEVLPHVPLDALLFTPEYSRSGTTVLAVCVAIGGHPMGQKIFEASGLPPGLSIDTRTGIIRGTPTRVGIYKDVTVKVVCGNESKAVESQWRIVQPRPDAKLY